MNPPTLVEVNETESAHHTIMYCIKNYDTKTFFINWTRGNNLKERLRLHKKRDLTEWLANVDPDKVKILSIAEYTVFHKPQELNDDQRYQIQNQQVILGRTGWRCINEFKDRKTKKVVKEEQSKRCKEYYAKNKDHIKQKNAGEYFCELCNKTMTISSKRNHEKSKAHLEKARLDIHCYNWLSVTNKIDRVFTKEYGMFKFEEGHQWDHLQYEVETSEQYDMLNTDDNDEFIDTIKIWIEILQYYKRILSRYEDRLDVFSALIKMRLKDMINKNTNFSRAEFYIANLDDE